MNHFLRKYLWLAATVISVSAPTAYADDLFDDSFFADPAPVDAVKQENVPDVSIPDTPLNITDNAPVDLPPPDSVPTPVAADIPAMPEPVPPPPAEPQLSFDMPAVPPPPPSSFDIPSVQNDIPAPTIAGGMDFGSPSMDAMKLSTPPSEQILGKVSSDIFREMAEMERENSNLMLQLKREKLRSEIDALKISNRQTLFDEIERREKMTQARLEWELAQDLKRQEALERKQRAEIRQKQIEAALKREEDRRIQKMKDEAAAQLEKERQEKEKAEKEKAELKKKYDAASLVRLQNLKPTLMAAARPAKIKRTASSKMASALTATGEDLLAKKKAGEALIPEIQPPISITTDEKKENTPREPASTLYTVAEIRGTAGALIAKLISKKDNATFFAKKSTILPTGHMVTDINKDFVLVKIEKNLEMIGFPSAGLVSENPSIPQTGSGQGNGQGQPENTQQANPPEEQKPARPVRRRRARPAPPTPSAASSGFKFSAVAR